MQRFDTPAPISAEARPAGLSAFGSFARFVLFGGGVGLASSAAVPLVATLMPWVVANALITVASTLLGTELHARFTFGAGRRAQWHQHVQSAGSATAAYLVTSAAILVLHAVQPSASMRWEQVVYLSASGLAGTGRFLVLRLYVFARDRTSGTDLDGVRPVRAGATPGGLRPTRRLPAPDHQRLRRTQETVAGEAPAARVAASRSGRLDFLRAAVTPAGWAGPGPGSPPDRVRRTGPGSADGPCSPRRRRVPVCRPSP
jgi:putative flippase GtrA